MAGHAVPAGEDIHLRLVEHVTHVQAAGDVGRGQQDGKWVRGRRIAWRGSRLIEELFADPIFGPVVFEMGGIVGFWQVVGHGVSSGRLACGPAGQANPRLGPTPHNSTGALSGVR